MLNLTEITKVARKDFKKIAKDFNSLNCKEAAEAYFEFRKEAWEKLMVGHAMEGVNQLTIEEYVPITTDFFNFRYELSKIIENFYANFGVSFALLHDVDFCKNITYCKLTIRWD